jgi:hypothetical protein
MHESDATALPQADIRRESFALRAILMAAARIELGELTVFTPTGYRHVFAGARPGPVATLSLHTKRAARRVLFGGRKVAVKRNDAELARSEPCAELRDHASYLAGSRQEQQGVFENSTSRYFPADTSSECGHL